MTVTPPTEALRANLASRAVAGSTLRTSIAKGSLDRIRRGFAKLDFSALQTRGIAACLDTWTDELSHLAGERFGPVRKSLNLYLRDLAYCVWTREAYGLSVHEPALEVPLDSWVMRKLKEQVRSLPSVPRLKDLSPAESNLFQREAARIAEEKMTFRVHLDLHYWTPSLRAKEARP